MGETSHLRGARIYLSGPMDFVASRVEEKTTGWRNRVGDFLRSLDAVVFDPWFKPAVRGLHQYGLEDINTIGVRGEFLGDAAHRSAHGRYERFHDRLRADQHLQRRHRARDHPLEAAGKA